MATDVQTFRIRFPEFCDKVEFSDPRVQLFLDDAVTIYLGENEDRWRGKYDYAHAYLAAHLLKTSEASELGDSSAKAGPINSKSAGGVSVSRSVTAKDRHDTDEFLMGTVYGQQFITVRNSCFVGVLAATPL